MPPFHIVVQARDMYEARRFYTNAVGCTEIRSNGHSIEFNLYGHLFVCHLNPSLGKHGKIASHYNSVDGDGLPVPRCGLVLEIEAWRRLAERLTQEQVDFMIEPCIRFEGEPDEEAIMVLLDPSGNGLEFNSFKNIATRLFAGG